MSFEFTLEVITSAPILFFLLGVLARLVRSDLDIPHPLPKLFSLYVLAAIGLRGGVQLAKSPLHSYYFGIIAIAILGSFTIALVGYFIFRLVTTHENAVALCASYGSISAITFITATSILDRMNIEYGPYMIAAMALMESPAILMAIFLHKRKQKDAEASFWQIMQHALVNQSVFLLLGSFIIGMILFPPAWKKIEMFYDGVFYGILTLFLLDLGLVAARRFEAILKAPKILFLIAIAFPVTAAFFGFSLGKLCHLSGGDTLLLMILFGSGSYIAVPAAMRTVVPDANPGLYLSLVMGITFPFNILIGIPFYLWFVGVFGG